MRTTQLSSGMERRTPERDDLVFRSDVEAIVNRVMADAERRLQQYVAARLPQETKPPVVNVQPAAVSVPDVKVEVEAPAVRVDPQIDVEVPGLADLAREIAGVRADLASLHTLLAQPVTRTVERDQAGWITSVTETR